jgi:hypothetical protein
MPEIPTRPINGNLTILPAKERSYIRAVFYVNTNPVVPLSESKTIISVFPSIEI